MNVAKVSLENGAEVNLQNRLGVLPIHLAAEYGFKNLVKLLIEHQADINAKGGSDGDSPLHIASVEGSSNRLRFLILLLFSFSLHCNVTFRSFLWAKTF